ncbi:MAG TPA: redoxin domain-containing protein [Candidatus Kapabacteria bacterium]|jgi:peroxiredoxin|nr:redoxin domain-containing protein [Candidatus Kapabacteria bacterium]
MEILLPVILGLLVVMVAGCWFALFQVVRQQGRILLRLDEIDARTAMAVANAVTNTAVDAVPTAMEAPVQERPPLGIAVGATVPEFRLRDVTGRMVALESYRGRRVLLVHWSTQCGFCDMMAPELAALQPALQEQGVELLLVSYGDAEANIRMASEYRFDAPVLLQKPGETIAAFNSLGTPVAYLLDEEGRVAESIAIGAEQVPALARRAAGARVALPGERPLSESRIPRDGLPAGTPAPDFTLPDLQGRTVSLQSYRGRRVLLVFSDPNCGPCDELAPHLARVHREHLDNNLAVVMIGRGDLAENQRKATELGLEFPVVMQEKWKLSKEYGIFATPVGYLIDENGVIQSDVAKGAGAILSLVDEH